MNNKYELGKEMYLNGKSLCSISKDLKISRGRFSTYLKKQGIEVKRLPHKKTIRENVFDKIDNEEKAYWLGFLYADGCIGNNNRTDIEIGLSVRDKSHIQKFKNFLNWDGKIVINDIKCRISFKNRHMHQALINLGCIPKKSLTLMFPSEDKVPKELQRHFIRGYFDGDGCFCWTNKTFEINIIGTKDMLENICKITNIDKNRIYSAKTKSKEVYRIVVGEKQKIESFLDFIYANSNIYLDRKYEKYKKYKNL